MFRVDCCVLRKVNEPMNDPTGNTTRGRRPVLLIALLALLLILTTRSVAAQGGGTHTVAAGETLTAIARRYETDLNTLMRLNKLGDPSLIRVGQVLVVPSSVVGSGVARGLPVEAVDLNAPAAPTSSEATRIYIALPGDTLSSPPTFAPRSPVLSK